MPLFKITTKRTVNCNGVRIEPGMSVQVVSQSPSNPVTTNGGTEVSKAFMRVHALDVKKAGALNMIYLDVERIK